MSHEAEALEELIKGIQIIVDNAMTATTKIYDGIVLSENKNGKWNVRYNGEIHPIKPYSSFVPTENALVKVYIPQGNHSLAYFAPKSGNLSIQQADEFVLGGVKALKKKLDQTQPVGIDDDGQLFVKDSIEIPIGTIYTSYDSTSPEILFDGTWEQVYADYTRECVGSQLLYENISGSAIAEKTNVIGAYNYILLEGIFGDIALPSNCHKEYKMTFQGYTSADENIVMYLNNIETSLVKTYSNATFRKIGSTGYFKEEDIVLEKVVDYESSEDNGINLGYAVTGENGDWKIYGVNLTGFIVSNDKIYKWKKIAGKENTK